MSYNEIFDHYENTRNDGSLDKNDPSVGTGFIGAPSCGNMIELQIKVNDKDLIEVLQSVFLNFLYYLNCQMSTK
ncbi:unnamed protein product [Brugia pahangi]|uniref:NifU_N domain-containing protein n=1 Tax=Brugia pahangi TaxID=6280 RepID=A0A0N4TXH5_BRUPA|nr:unnamed protein product [Brugia pahangi]